MNDFELQIWKAVREADKKFQRDGSGGTKCWIREYFMPFLAKHKLEIVGMGKLPTNAVQVIGSYSAEDWTISKLAEELGSDPVTVRAVIVRAAKRMAGADL